MSDQFLITPQEDARDKFSRNVQSIAFQLTLSRRMIDCLRAVRDYGFPHGARTSEDAETRRYETTCTSVVKRQHKRGTSSFITDNFVGFMRSLDNRGLVVWNQTDYSKRKTGDPALKLSRAGELTCELLVEAGLMPARRNLRRKSR